MSDWCAFIEEKARRVVDILCEPDVRDSDVEKILKFASDIRKTKNQRPYTEMGCKTTGKNEVQYVVRESEDGITLRCGGCGNIRSYEIGFFAEKYEGPLCREVT